MADDRNIATPLSTDTGRLVRVSEVVADVSRRLSAVCEHLSDEEFRALVRQIAEITVKYEALAEARAARVVTPALPVKGLD